MARKIYVTVETSLIIRADEGVEVSDILENMDYNFKSQTGGADVEDAVLERWAVTDSK